MDKDRLQGVVQVVNNFHKVIQKIAALLETGHAEEGDLIGQINQIYNRYIFLFF